MLRAQLREARIEALGMQATGDIGDFFAHGVAPSVIVVDGCELNDPAKGRIIEDLARIVAVIVVDSRTTPSPVLAGTDVL